MTTRVFLVDDHEIVRRGLADLIDEESDLEVVGEAGNAREALARIGDAAPDVAVLDVQLGDGSGIDVCRDVRSAHPRVACLILTAFDDDKAATAAVLAGAAGYVLKSIRGEALVDGIRRLGRGESLVDPRTAARAAAELSGSASPAESPLTPRERDVVELIAAGLTNRQIGERLGLTEKTVKNYVSAVLVKLGMVRRTQAAVYGAELRRR